MRNIYFEFGPVVQELSFKDISYLQFWSPTCFVEHNHVCNFGRGQYEKHFCEIVLNSSQLLRRCLL